MCGEYIIGSLTTIKLTLLIWVIAMIMAYFTEQRGGFWIVANLIGLTLGSSQSAGRGHRRPVSPRRALG
ncbi:hypothetical protein [Thiolapillus sp.]|uniref:hypothetical protein n=1 Tax=Thiolapillus sp. TaxID=2017437 RepID=UPI003AF7AB46